MTYAVRKISRPKWEVKTELGPDSIQADAITSDLRTKGNSLSLWECRSLGSLGEVVLALAASMDQAEKIDIAWVEIDLLHENDFALKRTEGNTPIEDLRDKHIDVVDLDLHKLGKVATILANCIRRKGHFRRFRRSEVKEILRKALRENRFPVNKLGTRLREELNIS